MKRLRRHLQRARGAHGLLALMLLGATAASAAQAPLSAAGIEKLRKTKAPEDWTVEERLAVRFDPGDISRRRKADRDQLMKTKAELPEIAEAQAAPPAPNDASNSVVGNRNPELFLPTEIFDALLKGAFSPDSQGNEVFRSSLEDGLGQAGLDARTFWTTLEGIAKGPIRAHQEFYELAVSLGRARTATEREAIVKHSEEIAAGMCAPRVAALAEARKRFGQKNFDRFLYRAVAPTMFQVLSEPNPEWANQLRRREAGCNAAAR